MHKYATEFVGTFLFVFSIALAVTNAGPFAPLAIGVALMCVVYLGGHISGGHYNPAVTLAVFMRGGFPARDFGPYVVAQLTGAMVAGFVSQMVTGTVFLAAPGADVSIGASLTTEILFTFFLALVVLNVATDKKVEGNSFYGLAIGATIVVAALAGGSVSGGAFNPAVGLGPVFAALSSKPVGHVWIYAVGPLLGGVLASAVYRIQHPPVE